jgi:MFS family permease
VPAEAHRLARRFGRRDRIVIGAAALAGVLGTAGAVAAGGSHAQRADSRCLVYSEAGAMGGGTWRLCGADAAAFCSHRGGMNSALAAQCARVTARRKPGS